MEKENILEKEKILEMCMTIKQNIENEINAVQYLWSHNKQDIMLVSSLALFAVVCMDKK